MALKGAAREFRAWELAQLALLYFPINFFWTAAVAQLLPARIESLAGQEKGFALAFVGAGGAFAASVVIFLVGAFSDATRSRFGRRFPWIAWGIPLGCVGALAFAFAPNLWTLLLAFIVARVGLGAALAAYEAILPDRVPLHQRAKASAWAEFWDLCGQVAGLAATGVMAVGALNVLLKKSWARPLENFYAELLICALSVGLLLVVLALNWRFIKENPPLEVPPVAGVLRCLFDLQIRQNSDFYWLFLSRVVLNIGTFTAVDFIRFYLTENFSMRGTDIASEVMWIGLATTLGGCGGAFLSGLLGDRLSKRYLLCFFCGLALGAVIGFQFCADLDGARWAAAIFGIGFSGLNAVNWAFATQLVPRGGEAKFLAIFNSCFTLPRIWVMGFGGIFAQNFGYRALFWTIPIYLIFGTVLLFRANEKNVAAP